MQVALIAFSAYSRLSELRASLLRQEFEVVDFYENHPLEALATARAFVLVGEEKMTRDDLIAVLKAQNALGKPILGLAEAAIFLAKYGFIPGLWDNRPAIGVLPEGLTATEVRLSPDYQYNAFTRYLSVHHRIPVAPSPVQWDIPPGLLLEVESQGLNVFVSAENSQEIAAISNKAGNTMAMLTDPMISPEGDVLWRSMKDHIASGYTERGEPLCYWKR